MIISFDTDNAAFDGPDYNQEIVRILNVIANRVLEDFSGGGIRDSNGNKIGHWNL